MITDPIFYRLFETSPETFFVLLGMSTDEARKMAARPSSKMPPEEIAAILEVDIEFVHQVLKSRTDGSN